MRIRATPGTVGLFAPALLAYTHALSAQEPRTGLELAGLPALNYDSDEGFGYGAIVEIYDYGTGLSPYAWTVQPTVFLTTEGRRDLTVFFDAPHLLPGNLRLDLFAGREEHIATPYYGLGNTSVYDESLESDPNPYFYRFGRTRWRVSANVQRPVSDGGLRLLFGVGAAHTTVDATPKDEGTTLLAGELAGAPVSSGWTNDVRVGLVWDTRDRESGPRSGVFTEVLIQRADKALRGDYSYTRTTLTDRRYVPIGSQVVLANRFLIQHVSDGAPLHDLNRIQTSFKEQEGLGGSESVRGIPKNRFAGRGLFLWNTELRWRAVDFSLLGLSLHTVLSAFVDAGRVWSGGVRLAEIFSDLHRGYGGGVRLGMGENFVAAFDAGTSADSGMQLYIGLGYMF